MLNAWIRELCEWTRGEVVDTDGAKVVEGEERVWEGRLCKEIVVQKPTSQVAATAYEEGGFTWASASGTKTVEVESLWGEGREQEPAGGLGDESRRMR